jgi:hypothetical protein
MAPSARTFNDKTWVKDRTIVLCPWIINTHVNFMTTIRIVQRSSINTSRFSMQSTACAYNSTHCWAISQSLLIKSVPCIKSVLVAYTTSKRGAHVLHTSVLTQVTFGSPPSLLGSEVTILFLRYLLKAFRKTFFKIPVISIYISKHLTLDLSSPDITGRSSLTSSFPMILVCENAVRRGMPLKTRASVALLCSITVWKRIFRMRLFI